MVGNVSIVSKDCKETSLRLSDLLVGRLQETVLSIFQTAFTGLSIGSGTRRFPGVRTERTPLDLESPQWVFPAVSTYAGHAWRSL